MALVFERSDEASQLAESLARLLRSDAAFEQRRERLSARPPHRLAMWPQLVDLGVVNLLAPPSLGGYGQSPGDVAAIFEAAASALLVEPLVATLMCLRALGVCRSPHPVLAQHMIEGRALVAFAHQERLDTFAEPTAKAKPSSKGFYLSGSKPGVRHADIATDFLVSATLENGRVGLFVIPRAAPGLEIELTRMIDGAGAGDVLLDEVLAPPAALIEDNAAAAVTEAMEWGLLALCVDSAALIEAVNRETFTYLRVREQFGQPLASFQALQHRAADMAVAEQEAAGMAVEAITAMGAAPSPERLRVMLTASLACDAAARMATHASVQLYGAMGVSDELCIAHFAKRAAANRTALGGTDARATRLAEAERVIV